jgi:hypothetical protein
MATLLSHPYSKFNGFWMPDQVRHDGFKTFYETINFNYIVFKQKFQSFKTRKKG